MVMAPTPEIDQAALARAEAEISEGRGLLDPLGRAACKLAARLACRLDNPRPGDDLLKFADALARVHALVPARIERRAKEPPRRYRLRIFEGGRPVACVVRNQHGELIEDWDEARDGPRLSAGEDGAEQLPPPPPLANVAGERNGFGRAAANHYPFRRLR
jgi:hypothetical protein